MSWQAGKDTFLKGKARKPNDCDKLVSLTEKKIRCPSRWTSAMKNKKLKKNDLEDDWPSSSPTDTTWS